MILLRICSFFLMMRWMSHFPQIRVACFASIKMHFIFKSKGPFHLKRTTCKRLGTGG